MSGSVFHVKGHIYGVEILILLTSLVQQDLLVVLRRMRQGRKVKAEEVSLISRVVVWSQVRVRVHHLQNQSVRNAKYAS